MLLYLNDAGPSLQAALQLIEQFVLFFFLPPQILPLDLGAPTADQAALPLVRASSIKYLGIRVSSSLTDYISLNLERHGLVSPLGLWDASIELKCYFSQITYFLACPSPYIPLCIFKLMESILNTLIWGPSPSQTIMASAEVSCQPRWHHPPKPVLFIASQFSHFFYFNQVDKIRYSILLCSPASHPVTYPFLILCGTQKVSHRGNRSPMVFHHGKIWQLTINLTKAYILPTRHCGMAPVSDPDHKLWIDKGVIYISRIIANSLVKSS